MKEKKPLSYFRRKYTKVPNLSHIPETERVYVQESVAENGTIVTRTAIKEIQVKDKFANFKVSDFAIQNLVAAGAVENLRTTTIAAGTSVESVEESLTRTESVINAAAAAAAAAAQKQSSDA